MHFYVFRDVVMAARFFHSANIAELEEALTVDARQSDAGPAVPSHASTKRGQSRRAVSWRNPSAAMETAAEVHTVVDGQEFVGCEATDGGSEFNCRRQQTPETDDARAGASASRAKEASTIGATEHRHSVQARASGLKVHRIAPRNLAHHKRSHRGVEHWKTNAMVRSKAMKCGSFPSGSGPLLKSRRLTAALRKTIRNRKQQGAETTITPS